MTAVVLIFLLSLCGLAHAETATSSVDALKCPAPTQLSCEFLLEPWKTVIYDPRPEFSWECGSGDQAFLQSAYEIVVRDCLPSGEGETVWNSGRIDGGDSLNIEYQGKPLIANGEYVWQVRAWNNHQSPSEWSEPQQFRMADTLNETETSRYSVTEVEHFASYLQALDESTYLLDFGTAAFGYLKFRVPPADRPRELQITFGEKLGNGRIDRDPGGSIRTYTVDAIIPAETAEFEVRPPKNRQNTTGDAIRLPDSVGVIAPFRFAEIRGLSARPGLKDIAQVRIEYPFDENASSFNSADAALNAVWDLCKYSIRATTFCGVYVDGDRERIPYEADAYINQLSHYGVDREYALARYSHEYLLANPTWPTEWKLHSIFMAWADYMHTGDRESLERNYEVLKGKKLLVAGRRPDGLFDTSLGDYHDIVDWPVAERDGHDMVAVNSVVNAFQFAALERMAMIADALGRLNDSSEFRAQAGQLRQSFNAKLWDPAISAYLDGLGSRHSSIHSNLFPLAFGLVSDDRADAVADYIESRGMACSVYAAQYLLESLYLAERDEYALKLMTDDGVRGWLNMIKIGSTITLESWDQQFKPNLDWNHAWGAAPANIIPFWVVGVRPLEPGFRRLVVQPRPGRLASFSAKIPTIRGPVLVDYRRELAAIRMSTTIPGNCLANVAIQLPVGEVATRLMVDGNESTFAVGDRHIWISGLSPGPHRFILSLSQTATEAAAAFGGDLQLECKDVLP